MFKRENQLVKTPLDEMHEFTQRLGGEGVKPEEFDIFRTDAKRMEILGRIIRTICRTYDRIESDDVIRELEKSLSEKGMDIDLVVLLLMKYGWQITKINKPEGCCHDYDVRFFANKECGHETIHLFILADFGEHSRGMCKTIKKVKIAKPRTGKDPKEIFNVSENLFCEILKNPIAAMVYQG